jgi:phage baseplate assembly protein W
MLTTDRGFLGRGWRFPIQPDALGRLTFAGPEQDVEQAIWIILGTSKGERPMLSGFGCTLQDLVFEPNSDLVRGAIATEVQQALVKWEPRIDVLEISVEAAEGEPNLMLIRVDYRIRSANTIHNLVYPFYITEGGA